MAGHAHGEHDDSDTPAVDDLVVAFVRSLVNDFRREIHGRAAHGLVRLSTHA